MSNKRLVDLANVLVQFITEHGLDALLNDEKAEELKKKLKGLKATKEEFIQVEKFVVYCLKKTKRRWRKNKNIIESRQSLN